MVREKLIVEEKKRKELKSELTAKSEKRVEDPPLATDVEMEELKLEVKERKVILKMRRRKDLECLVPKGKGRSPYNLLAAAAPLPLIFDWRFLFKNLKGVIKI